MTEKKSTPKFLIYVVYIALFALQIMPLLVVDLVGLQSPIFWISCVVGAVALIVQTVKYRNFNHRKWSMDSMLALVMVLMFTVAELACRLPGTNVMM